MPLDARVESSARRKETPGSHRPNSRRPPVFRAFAPPPASRGVSGASRGFPRQRAIRNRRPRRPFPAADSRLPPPRTALILPDIQARSIPPDRSPGTFNCRRHGLRTIQNNANAGPFQPGLAPGSDSRATLSHGSAFPFQIRRPFRRKPRLRTTGGSRLETPPRLRRRTPTLDVHEAKQPTCGVGGNNRTSTSRPSGRAAVSAPVRHAPMERLPKTLPAGNRSGKRRVGRANGERPKTATATNSPTMTREPVRYHAKPSRRARKVGAGPRRMSGLHRNTGCRGTNDANHAFGDQALRGPCRGVASPLSSGISGPTGPDAADGLSRNVRSAAGFPAAGRTPAAGAATRTDFLVAPAWPTIPLPSRRSDNRRQGQPEVVSPGRIRAGRRRQSTVDSWLRRQ